MLFLRRRRERRLQEADAFRSARRLAAEDVTVLGEGMADLHFETLTTEIDEPMRIDYTVALNRYDEAKAALAAATTLTQLDALATVLADARWARARVLARRDGQPLPERREECFFNPQHGPARFDLDWTPPGGTCRTIAVCATDHQRLTRGEEPAIRLVRSGDRYVPWYAATAEASSHSAHVSTGAYTGHSSVGIVEAHLRRTGEVLGGGGLVP